MTTLEVAELSPPVDELSAIEVKVDELSFPLVGVPVMKVEELRPSTVLPATKLDTTELNPAVDETPATEVEFARVSPPVVGIPEIGLDVAELLTSAIEVGVEVVPPAVD